MKIKDGFILRKIAGVNIVVPIGKRTADFNGLIALNETGAFLWRNINNAESTKDLVSLLFEEYEVDFDTAYNDTIEFLKTLKEGNVLEE